MTASNLYGSKRMQSQNYSYNSIVLTVRGMLMRSGHPYYSFRTLLISYHYAYQLTVGVPALSLHLYCSTGEEMEELEISVWNAVT